MKDRSDFVDSRSSRHLACHMIAGNDGIKKFLLLGEPAQGGIDGLPKPPAPVCFPDRESAAGYLSPQSLWYLRSFAKVEVRIVGGTPEEAERWYFAEPSPESIAIPGPQMRALVASLVPRRNWEEGYAPPVPDEVPEPSKLMQAVGPSEGAIGTRRFVLAKGPNGATKIVLAHLGTASCPAGFKEAGAAQASLGAAGIAEALESGFELREALAAWTQVGEWIKEHQEAWPLWFSQKPGYAMIPADFGDDVWGRALPLRMPLAN